MSNYEVGYRKPPKSTRFQKGKSGNPRGRPRKAQKPIYEILQDLLSETVVLTEGNRRRRVSIDEALLRRFLANALKGEPRELLTMLKLFQSIGALKPPEAEQQGGVLVLPANYKTYDEWVKAAEEHQIENERREAERRPYK